MAQDLYQAARENYDDSVDGASEQRRRMVEDMRFSNPTDPEQWDEKVALARQNDSGGPRPTFVFDQTNQYIAQVVNDSRMNKPQIQTVPASSGSDQKVSDALDGMIRQIEYASSASMAYDTAQEHAARTGLGWFRIIPKVIDEEYNAQEIRILRVHDPLAVRYDPSFTSPDGSDQTFGFIETEIPKGMYQRLYKKKSVSNWKTDKTGWFSDNTARICEYFVQKEFEQNNIIIDDPDLPNVQKDKRFSHLSTTVSEDDYWDVAQKTGVKLKTRGNYMTKKASVKWYKMDGDDFLEDPTDFPSQWIPLIPVMGYELWIEGKRYLCGMVRRMRAGQQAYNMERNASLEWMAKQPKAPYLMPWEAVSEHQGEWASANTSDKAYLPYDHLDSEGNPLPAPQRLNPPSPGAAFQNLGQQGLNDLQASIGMFNANLGKQGNETSGIAIKRREQQGDTANFHYIDNLSRSMSHAGRMIVDMIPRLYDTEREARILGLDGSSDMVKINPSLKTPFKLDGKKVSEINLSSGTYDVRCKVGPAYASLREEAADSLTKIVQQSPQLMTILGPMWARMQDWPEAEKVSKLLLAMAPPQIQALENSDVDIPPQLMAQMQQMKQQLDQAHQQMQQMQQALGAAHQEIQTLGAGIQKDLQIAQIREQGATEREQMKLQAQGQHVQYKEDSISQRDASKHDAATQHVDMKEQGQNIRALAGHHATSSAQDTSVQVAEINAATSQENARLAAIVQLVLKQMEPVQMAEEEITEGDQFDANE